MSIRIKDLVGNLKKEHEKIVADEFDRRYPNTGILDFTIHAKSQFILRGYNDNDMKQMLKVIKLQGIVGREYVIRSETLQYGLAVVRYPNRFVVKTTLERFRTKTKDEKIVVEGIEMETLWTK